MRLFWPSGLSLLVLALAVFHGAGACQSGAVPPRFPHRLHLAGIACGAPGQPECLSCASCHAVAETGAGLRHPEAPPRKARALPNVGVCVRCHRDESQMGATLTRPIERPYGQITIHHDRHLALDAIRGQCVPCHAGVVDERRPALPPMSQCFGCHEHQSQWERGECTPCHEPQDLARTLPVTFLRHDAAFLRQHGAVIAQNSQQASLCQSCHTQAQCQSCHDLTQDLSVEARRPERLDSRQVHRGDFMVRHAIEARSEPARCLSCHALATCDSCHLARGVSGALPSGRNPHPPEWIGSYTQSSNFHGAAARRDILSCAGCHEAGPATNCIRCHKVGAYGGNPHPSGWRSARDPSDRMCRYCHE